MRLVGRTLTQRQTNNFSSSKQLSDYLRCITDGRAGGCLMGVQWWTIRGGGSLAYRTLAGGGVPNTATLTHVHTNRQIKTPTNTTTAAHTHSHTSQTTEGSRDLKVRRLILLFKWQTVQRNRRIICEPFLLCAPLLLRVSSKWCEVFQNILMCLPQGSSEGES